MTPAAPYIPQPSQVLEHRRLPGKDSALQDALTSSVANDTVGKNIGEDMDHGVGCDALPALPRVAHDGVLLEAGGLGLPALAIQMPMSGVIRTAQRPKHAPIHT